MMMQQLFVSTVPLQFNNHKFPAAYLQFNEPSFVYLYYICRNYKNVFLVFKQIQSF